MCSSDLFPSHDRMWHYRIQKLGAHRHTHQQIQKGGVTIKEWNVRDQTEEELGELLIRKYKEIDSEYKILRKVSDIQNAKNY